MRHATRPAEERFWEKVERPTEAECWPWLGARGPKGYGMLRSDHATTVRAHRFSYEIHIGQIPEGMVIDHLCRNPTCVNPAHLEAVTSGENTRRGITGKHHADKTHCPRGHPYDEKNTYHFGPGLRWRGCRECRRQAAYDYRIRASATEVAYS